MIQRLWLVFGFVLSSSLLAAPAYVATPLGTLGGDQSAGYSINAAGDITGYAYTAAPQSNARAFVYSGGVMHDLGTIQSPNSYGQAINSHGQVAGYGYTGDGSPTSESYLLAFSFLNGVMQDLGGLGGHGAKATGINDQGKVVGWSYTPGDTTVHAFVYANGTMQDIGTLPGGTSSEAYAINASGQITGRANLPTSDPQAPIEHAIVYSGGSMHDLGSLMGPSGHSEGYAINDQGIVTGTASMAGVGASPPPYHAFIYSGGSMRDIGTLGGIYTFSYGFGINNAAQIVGTSTNLLGDLQRAFLYTNGTIHDLNSLVVSGLGSVTLTEARDINDSGQIVATGCGAISTICQAFRLDPVPGTPAVHVPVPVVEFYYLAFDHYFMTADPGEISVLDSGALPGWTRTGQSFKAFLEPTVGAQPVCRFFNVSFAPKSSHFYSADPNECLFLRIDSVHWHWQFEGVTMYIPTPDVQGNCAAGTHPIYRLYNDGIGGAPNHRFTASTSVRAQMIAQGWISEGYGANGVTMCAPN